MESRGLPCQRSRPLRRMPQPSQSCRRHRYGKAFYRPSNSLWPERLSEYYPTQVGEMVGGRNRRNARDRHDAGRQPGRWPNGGGGAQYFATWRRGSRRDGGLHQIAAATLIHLGSNSKRIKSIAYPKVNDQDRIEMTWLSMFPAI